MSTVLRAGCAEVRKLMRRYRGYKLESEGRSSHQLLRGPDGELVRLPDGRPLTIVCTPRDPDRYVRQLERSLSRCGVEPS